jgi:hypothetical protein
MKYSHLIESLPSNTIVFAFGRFQPPTIGHSLLVNAVKIVSSKEKADHMIFASKTQDKKKNPLPVNRKIYYLNKMFPNVNFIAADNNIRTFMEVAAVLNNKYKNLIMIAGSDRVPEYTKTLNAYNGKDYNYNSIKVISAGERDPDSDTASGMSATKMREAAKANNLELFRKGLPNTLTTIDCKHLMNEIRTGLNLVVEKEYIKLESNELREQYINGLIFNINDIVESNDVIYKIRKRGSNHLLLQDQSGKFTNKWLYDVVQSDKEYILQEGLMEMKFSASDKIKVARIIASALGIENVEKSSNAESLVNQALRKVKNKVFRPEYMLVLQKMLKTASEAEINYDENLIPKSIEVKEDIYTSEFTRKPSRDENGALTYDELGNVKTKKGRPHRIDFAASKMAGKPDDTVDKVNTNYLSYKKFLKVEEAKSKQPIENPIENTLTKGKKKKSFIKFNNGEDDGNLSLSSHQY